VLLYNLQAYMIVPLLVIEIGSCVLLSIYWSIW